ncbi:MAG: DUF4175 family protein [candidate division KSB1 bacterium]|nr:DUF4175 family protein [candidate division KSB1 bacterium]
MKITTQLKRYRYREKLAALATGCFKAVVWILPALVILLSAEAVFHFPMGLRAVPVGLGLIYIIAVFGVYTGSPLYRLLLRPSSPSLLQTAYAVGEKIDSVHDRLGNALDVFIHIERDKHSTSRELALAALDAEIEQCQSFDLSKLVDHGPVKRSLRQAGVVTLISIMILVLFYTPMLHSWDRFVHPFTDYTHQQSLVFSVDPGDATVVSGDSLQISVQTSDSTLKHSEMIVQYKTTTDQRALKQKAPGVFTTTLMNIRKSFTYRIRAQSKQSPEYTVSVLERPVVRELSLQVTPPAYTGLTTRSVEKNVGNVTALPGARVHLNATANKPLHDAALLFSDSTLQSLDVQNETIYGAFRLYRDVKYQIQLTDRDSLSNPDPISYQVKALADQYPFVEITSPGRDIELGDDMRIPLAVNSQDDYGISRVQLGYQVLHEGRGNVDSTGFSFKTLETDKTTQIETNYDWDTEETHLLPTDVLVYFVRVYDNDTVNGPKSSETRRYRARFPSLAEMYDTFTQTRETTTDKIKDTFQKSQNLQKRVDRLSRELKREQKIDWQKRKEIEETVKQHRQIQNDLNEIEKNIQKMLDQGQKDQLLSPETLEKYEKIQELYREIETAEMQELMKQMGQKLDQFSREDLQQAMEKMREQEQDLNQSLDRTLELLKRLKTEQQLDQAARMARDLAERQKKMAGDSSGSMERMQREQDRIESDHAKLKNLLKDIQESMQNQAEPPKEMVNRALSELEAQSLEDALSNMQKIMQQSGDMRPSSEQISQSFQKAASDLETAKQMLNGELMRKLLQAMQKNARQLLDLSKSQENIGEKTRSLSENSPDFPQVADEQERTRSALNRVIESIIESARQSLQVSPRINESLGQADQEMQNALQKMEQRNARPAAQHQENAMVALNSAVQGIQSMMQNMMQQGGQGGMSMQSFMQQMQKMADAQQQINQNTPSLSSGQMSLQQQAAISRLAAQQKSLRKAMQELSGQMADNGEILGSLEKIADDMKKVEDDFLQNNIDPETIQRQNRILSRMLDSQKSVREREYSRKRKAETGSYYSSESPEDLPNTIYDKNKLNQYLLRAKEEGYTRDYLELIEQYYKALSRHNEKK